MRIFNIIYRTADNTVAEANSAATSKGKATAVVGKVITCTDITADQFTNDTPDKVKEVLMNGGFGEAEAELISALVREHINKNCNCAKAEEDTTAHVEHPVQDGTEVYE